MEIKKVMVQTGLGGADQISIVTDLPESIYPFRDTGATLKFDVASGNGVEYVKKHFGKYKIMVLDHRNEFEDFGWEEV